MDTYTVLVHRSRSSSVRGSSPGSTGITSVREGITRMGSPSRSDPSIVRACRTAFSVSNATNATRFLPPRPALIASAGPPKPGTRARIRTCRSDRGRPLGCARGISRTYTVRVALDADAPGNPREFARDWRGEGTRSSGSKTMLPLDRRPARSWTGDAGCCCCCCCCCHAAAAGTGAGGSRGGTRAERARARRRRERIVPGRAERSRAWCVGLRGGPSAHHPLVDGRGAPPEPPESIPRTSPVRAPTRPAPGAPAGLAAAMPAPVVARAPGYRDGLGRRWIFAPRLSTRSPRRASPRDVDVAGPTRPGGSCCCVASATPPPALVDSGVGRALDASSALDDPPRSPSSVGAASSAESPPITDPPPPVARPQRNAPSRERFSLCRSKGKINPKSISLERQTSTNRPSKARVGRAKRSLNAARQKFIWWAPSQKNPPMRIVHREP